MVLLFILGVCFIGTGIIMLSTPKVWLRVVLWSNRQTCAHLFGILAKLTIAGILFYYAENTINPLFMQIFSVSLIAAGLAQTLTPAKQHLNNVKQSTQQLFSLYRPAGVSTLLIGSFLVYSSL